MSGRRVKSLEKLSKALASTTSAALSSDRYAEDQPIRTAAVFDSHIPDLHRSVHLPLATVVHLRIRTKYHT